MGKYEEALERARKGLPIDEVFPELKESEESKGERIRKALLEYFNERNSYRDEDETFNGVPFSSIIAYLENQQPAEWSEEDKEFIKDLCNLLAAIVKNNYVGCYYAPELINKLSSLRLLYALSKTNGASIREKENRLHYELKLRGFVNPWGKKKQKVTPEESEAHRRKIEAQREQILKAQNHETDTNH